MRPQAWARGRGTSPAHSWKYCKVFWKYCKVFFVLQMLSKVSIDDVFIPYFEKMSSASGGSASMLPTRALPLDLFPGKPSRYTAHLRAIITFKHMCIADGALKPLRIRIIIYCTIRRRLLKMTLTCWNWPWKTFFQQCRLTLWIFVSSFIEIRPLTTDTPRHAK